jgi:hypothetical protein
VAPSKRQTTMAKLAREQAVREKRVRKQEKKDDRKAAALLGEQPLDEAAEDEDGVAEPVADGED